MARSLSGRRERLEAEHRPEAVRGRLLERRGQGYLGDALLGGIDECVTTFLRSRLEIPLSHVTGAEADPEVALGWWKSLRAAGTYLPGVIAAVTFYQEGEKVFWDVHDPEKTVVIRLRDEQYSRLVVEVDDPPTAVAAIQEALKANFSVVEPPRMRRTLGSVQSFTQPLVNAWRAWVNVTAIRYRTRFKTP